ncbi:gfo/Idh/MocA family oxidoreductase [Mycetocola tolaasinivorans]|uniref:Gfo/Idh/MocA family oxidoreductase n=1 Tax=Mycetocola tolaasinivorans TaxID=76635 RepID=A0A3L7A304_9MICO|nr:Gfo/Idh/MocA family oxidoreductase [Mycetocola tolaasinivorans]RLP74713.1 gfo/Idh/MocA family oxidoreductase [Mycetocola tolaasinivorans]
MIEAGPGAQALRIGIVGAGVMAATHAEAWARCGAREVRVLVRTDRRLPEGFGYSARATVFTDEEAFFAGLDILDICSPTDTHPRLALRAAAAGVSTLCEKPLAPDGQTAARIERAFATSSTALVVGHILRFGTPARVAREALLRGDIGELRALRLSRLSASPARARPWFADVRRSGGVIADLMIHDLDLAEWFAGETESVCAVEAPGLPGGGTASALTRHVGGATASIEASWDFPTPGYESGFDLVGERGIITFRQGGVPLLWETGAEAPRALTERMDDRIDPFVRVARALLRRREQDAAAAGERGIADGGVGRGPVLTLPGSARDAVRAVRLTDAARASVRSGLPVRPERG